jgi:hypothetical protein
MDALDHLLGYDSHGIYNYHCSHEMQHNMGSAVHSMSAYQVLELP